MFTRIFYFLTILLGIIIVFSYRAGTSNNNIILPLLILVMIALVFRMGEKWKKK